MRKAVLVVIGFADKVRHPSQHDLLTPQRDAYDLG